MFDGHILAYNGKYPNIPIKDEELWIIISKEHKKHVGVLAAFKTRIIICGSDVDWANKRIEKKSVTDRYITYH